jgi:hypothetical protein
MARSSAGRASRRPAVQTTAAARPDRPRPARPDAAPAVAAQRTISWRHCLIGLAAGEVLLLLLANLGNLVANAAFGAGNTSADGGIVGVATLLSVIAGGWLAARLAGRFGLYQGCVVAIGFIAVGALVQFAFEAQIVATSISAGGRKLVDLGPMNLGNVVTGDLLALFGGSVGGLLSGKR